MFPEFPVNREYGMPIFVVLLLTINGINIFASVSPEQNETRMAISALVPYFVFAIIAY